MNATKTKWYIYTLLTKLKYGAVGKHSYIGRPMFIQRPKNFFVGNNVRIYPGMRVELTQQAAKIKIEDNVSIGQNFHIVSYDSDLIISANTTVSGNVFISNVSHDYHEIDVHSLNQKMIVKPTVIGEYCFIGYGSVILSGTKLGRQCVVGANSVVSGEFPDYCVIAGSPARIIRTYNPLSGQWEKTLN